MAVGLLLLLQIMLLFSSAEYLAFYPGGYLWSVITYMFVHLNPAHLIKAWLFGFIPCIYVENKLGSFKFLASFLFCGIIGLICHVAAMHGNTVLVGSEAALFGMLALAASLCSVRVIAMLWLILVLGLQFYWLFLGVLQGIAIPGQIGGLIGGLLLASLLKDRERNRD